MSDPAARFQAAFGYHFEDQALFERAITHSSYAAENDGDESNERLEFLGDAVLQLAVSGYLVDRHPDLAEGEMTKVRAGVVNAAALAQVAESCGLGDALLLGRGEEDSGGRT